MNSHNNIFALPTSLRFLLETSSQILLAFNNTPLFFKKQQKIIEYMFVLCYDDYINFKYYIFLIQIATECKN